LRSVSTIAASFVAECNLSPNPILIAGPTIAPKIRCPNAINVFERFELEKIVEILRR
jgi:hypothetical protein